MRIIRYHESERKEHWLEEIARCEWRAAAFLAELLRGDRFHAVLGSGDAYLLTGGDRLVSFLTLTERDCIDAPGLAPWIGFVYTAPEYRGARRVGWLIDHACAAARRRGIKQVYICTDHTALYEKYGFTYLENRVSIYGEVSRVYVRQLGEIAIAPLTKERFPQGSLMGFVRHQEVQACWRCVDGEWRLMPVSFTEEWDVEQLAGKEAGIRNAIAGGHAAIGAFDGSRIVGFALLGCAVGEGRIELDMLHVSAPYRHQGLGRRLFEAACDAARSTGAKSLYISAHSSRESQAAYRAMGCTESATPDPAHTAAEPFDVQMEYRL